MNNIHIGSIIQQEMKRQGRSVSWLARQLCYERGNIYRIFHSKSIDTDTLYRISKELDKDFFQVYSCHL